MRTDPLTVIEETYEDLNMSEVVDWDTWEQSVEEDIMAAGEENYLTEDDDGDDEYLYDMEDEDED